MDRLGAETLQGLLQTYRVALDELRATDDPAMQPLIADLARLQAEAVVALAHARLEVSAHDD
jgi:hypothetical protein